MREAETDVTMGGTVDVQRIPTPTPQMSWNATHCAVGVPDFMSVRRSRPTIVMAQATQFAIRYLPVVLMKAQVMIEENDIMNVLENILTLEWMGPIAVVAWKYTGM